MADRVLVVSATAAEAAHVPADLPLVITGLGKTAAAAATARALASYDDLAGLTVVNIGTAGALRKVAGRNLDAALLESVIADLGSRAPGRIAAAHGLERSRARTIVAGALILAEAQRRLDVPFEVARGGLREGAALALARVAQAA